MKNIPGQLLLEDILKVDHMYDGYMVKNTRTISVSGNRIKIHKGDICHVLCKSKNVISIAFPNKYGGSFGFSVTLEQFQDNFKAIGKKIYPVREEIWNGNAWVPNPSVN